MLQFYAGGVLMRAKGYDRPDNTCALRCVSLWGCEGGV